MKKSRNTADLEFPVTNLANANATGGTSCFPSANNESL